MSQPRVLFSIIVLCFLSGLYSSELSAVELTGRLSAAAAFYDIDEGNTGIFYSEEESNLNQQTLRLMLDEIQESWSGSFHLKGYRIESNGVAIGATSTSDHFRTEDLSNREDIQNKSQSDYYIYEVDVMNVERNFEKASITLGRQAIDWGTGRFWQPMNVFGAFAPTDIDTDYKPGVDGVVLDIFPAVDASLTAAYVLSPDELSEQQGNLAVFYRKQIGRQHEVSFIAGEVLENRLWGLAFESDWKGLGWRVEGVEYQLDINDEKEWLWIAGLDYFFESEIFFSAEFYNNGFGVTNEQDILGLRNNPLVESGIQQQLGKNVFAFSLSKDFTPLLNMAYAGFFSQLESPAGDKHGSVLNQVSARYSLADNTDFQASILSANGRGTDGFGAPRSEFGYLDRSATLRIRHYF